MIGACRGGGEGTSGGQVNIRINGLQEQVDTLTDKVSREVTRLAHPTWNPMRNGKKGL